VACAEGAGEGFANVGGAERRREIDDGGEDEGCGIGIDVGAIVRTVGEGGRGERLLAGGGVGEGRLDGELGDEGWAGQAWKRFNCRGGGMKVR
jgi:hypothetical protein